MSYYQALGVLIFLVIFSAALWHCVARMRPTKTPEPKRFADGGVIKPGLRPGEIAARLSLGEPPCRNPSAPPLPKRFADGGAVGTNIGELPVVIQTGLDLPLHPVKGTYAPRQGFDPAVFDYQRELSEAEARAKLAEFRKMHPEIADYWHRVTDPMVENVVTKFRNRSRVGTEKYGTTLDSNPAPFDEWVIHLQEELMDATNYCETLLARHHKFNSERSLLQSAFDLMLAENKEMQAHIAVLAGENATLHEELVSLHNAMAGEP